MVVFKVQPETQQFFRSAAEIGPGHAQLSEILPFQQQPEQDFARFKFFGIEHVGAGVLLPEQDGAPLCREDLRIVPVDGLDHGDVGHHLFIEVFKCLGVHWSDFPS